MNLIMEAMNEVDEDLVRELSGRLQKDAAQSTAGRKKKSILKRLALPAAACLLLAAGILAGSRSGLFARRDYSDVWLRHFSAPSPETMYSSYRTRIKDTAWSSYRISLVCPGEAVGEKLGEVTAEGAWVSYGYSGAQAVPLQEPAPEQTETMRAELFALRDISPEYAVCLHLPDPGSVLSKDRFYTFLNRDASFESLEALKKGLNAGQRLSVIIPEQMPGAQIREAKKDDIAYTNYPLSEIGAEEIRKALLAADGTLLTAGQEEAYWKDCSRLGSFQVLLDGLVRAGILVSDSGCLLITPAASDPDLNTVRAYAVGKEAAQAILKAIVQSGAAYESETVTGVTVWAK